MSKRRITMLGITLVGAFCLSFTGPSLSNLVEGLNGRTGDVASQDETAATLAEGAGYDPVLIVTVQSRELVVHIYTGGRYSVTDAEGEALAELVSEDELPALCPQVHEDLQRMLAGSALWADLRAEGRTPLSGAERREMGPAVMSIDLP